eukprot:1141877-Pelagomonas_calceolata.AAC.3
MKEKEAHWLKESPSPEDKREANVGLKQTNETYCFISDLMDTFCVAGTVEQAKQPNYLADKYDL